MFLSFIDYAFNFFDYIFNNISNKKNNLVENKNIVNVAFFSQEKKSKNKRNF